MVLGTTDIVLLVLSLLASAAIGVYYGVMGIQSTPLEYLLGGRSMKPLPLAMSMMVGTVSAITILGNSGEMYAYGTQLWVMDVGILLGLIIIAKVFIPIMYPLHMVSLYQYVERRFHSRWLRQATVLLQLLGGYSFIGFLLFPPAFALKYITGFKTSYNIIIIGAICTLYSAFGGVKAVVYTDVLQSLVMVGGVLAIVIQGAISRGGLDKVIDIAYHNDRIEFFNMDPNPYQRHSFWLCIILGFFYTMGTYGVNQSQTQRYFSTGSVSQAQWVLYYSAIGMVILRALIHLSGLVMYVSFKDCDPLTITTPPQDPLSMPVTYVNSELTKIPGMAGLFVAAVYAAVLSSVSTQLNSMTALLWEDFLKTMSLFKSWSEVKIGNLQKALVMATGVLGIVLGLAVSQLGWSFLRTVFAINGALSGPLVGLFLSAIYLPWVNTKGASTGFLVAIIMNLIMAMGQLSMPKAEYLPLSRDGCPGPASNATLTPVLTPPSPPPPGEWLFGLSYCLNSLVGTLVYILVAVIVSAATGCNSPEDVEEKLIAPKSWKLFQRSLSQQIIEFIQVKILRKATPTSPANSEPCVLDPLNNSKAEKDNKDCDVENRV